MSAFRATPWTGTRVDCERNVMPFRLGPTFAALLGGLGCPGLVHTEPAGSPTKRQAADEEAPASKSPERTRDQPSSPPARVAIKVPARARHSAIYGILGLGTP